MNHPLPTESKTWDFIVTILQFVLGMTPEHHRVGNASSRPNLLMYFIVQKCFVNLN